MEDVIIGIVAIGVGAVFCFRGYLSMRLVFPLWGAFVGFMFGATLVTAFDGDRFLGSLLGWAVGLATGILFAILAYTFYAVSVFIGMATIGYVLGTALLVALGVEWQWLIVLAGIALGGLLAAAAIALDLPVVILTVLTAASGATAMVAGIMLIVGTFGTDDFSRSGLTDRIGESPWWWALDAGLAIAGVISQVRATERMRETLRESWEGSGGRSPQPVAGGGAAGSQG